MKKEKMKIVFFTSLSLVSIASLWPSQDLPSNLPWDKASHTIAYFLITLLGLSAYPQRHLRIIVAVFTYGVCIEILQEYLPLGRTGEWFDLLANGIGMLIAYPFFIALRAIKGIKNDGEYGR